MDDYQADDTPAGEGANPAGGFRGPSLALWARSGDVLSRPEGSMGALTETEAARGERLRQPGDQRDFAAAHLLVRWCAARVGHMAPAEVVLVQRCPACGGPHGPPSVAGRADLHVSLSHARGLVAAAAGWTPIGVDIETLRLEGLLVEHFAGALTVRELAAVAGASEPGLALLRQWVRKEALVKAGAVDLDGLAGIDLCDLPIDNDIGQRSAAYGRWCFVDWFDPVAGAVGSVVAGVPTVVERTA